MSEKKRLSVADITSAADVKTIEVDVPEWGGPLFLRQMTAGGMNKQLEDLQKFPNDGMCVILIHCAVDGPGPTKENPDEPVANLLFTIDDLPMLRQRSMAVLDRLQRECIKLNSGKEAAVLKKD